MSKTTSIAGVDQKLKALQELKLEQYKRQTAKMIAVMKDPNATAADIKQAFAGTWVDWIAQLPVEVIERRMRGWGEEAEPTSATASDHAVEPQPELSKSQARAVSFEPQLEISKTPARAVPPTPPLTPLPTPAPSAGGGLCIIFPTKGEPAFYAFEPNGTITLTDHSGTPIKVSGKMFQAKLDRGENADEVAQALWRESRGDKHDHFDGPILYKDPPVY